MLFTNEFDDGNFSGTGGQSVTTSKYQRGDAMLVTGMDTFSEWCMTPGLRDRAMMMTEPC